MSALSDYELLRQANIARNKAAMVSLNIPTIIRAGAASGKRKQPKAKKTKTIPTSASSRRSSRIAAAPKRRKIIDSGGGGGDDESDAEYAVSDDDDEDVDEYTVQQPTRRARAAPTADIGTPSSTPVEQSSVLTVEAAKSGRAKCRVCMEPIAAGEMRCGMTAWIMGRQSMTWSHPKCCITNLIVAVESTGRGKCKLTGDRLVAGAPKLGVRSHTATSWINIVSGGSAGAGAGGGVGAVTGNVSAVLAPVLSVVPTVDQAAVDEVLGAIAGGAGGGTCTIEGFDELGDEEHETIVMNALQQAVTKASEIKETAIAAAAATAEGGADVKPAAAAAAADGGGSNGRLTGKVAWKWGSHTCYGKLVKSRETKAHCYATTHKGNIKTLAKGKDYWWQV